MNPASFLTDRTQCILYYASEGPTAETCKSWIGGNAPAYFDDKADFIHEGDQFFYFYMSIAHPFKPAWMISVFIPQSYEEYLEHNIYPDCSIKVIEHPVSAESTQDIFKHPGLIRHKITDGEVRNDHESVEEPFLIKFGGTPRLIQKEGFYSKRLAEDLLSFLFQVDEDGYPDTLLVDHYSYPFGYGALYIYAGIQAGEVKAPVAGFWQFS
ncbi:hypothetical protein ACTHPF_20175 [Paenibacillus sp. SAF-054]|uniref:hypothetical protein n=1 Tax=unclassified Paenibacillus TaxID=185978 RepID=UPI003F7E0AB6